MAGRFDRLFEPVKLGPVRAPNRFYQVPHCSGMGFALPQTLAAMREVKAEGGWGVVNTEYCSIHPSSDDMPYPFATLWDEADIRNHARMTEAVHRHGALAGVELWHGGARSANLFSRETALSATSVPISHAPWQTRAMDRQDIENLRRWHREAAERARIAGFDIVYVYAAHQYLIPQFLDGRSNTRTDKYGAYRGGVRLLNELLEDLKNKVGDRCAVALRIDVGDETNFAARSELLADVSPLVDLFDVTVPDYSHEMGSSRFVREGSLEDRVRHVRTLTGKPVVSVGRFTSPDEMLRQVNKGIVDLIGAARPSIADPFLPNKIREGRYDDIRECIGCNICYAHDGLGVPIRCTQNPTMGEEWRRKWHPERVRPLKTQDPVLVVGAGPAGLEAALTLGRRGARVILAEASRELGGRINFESRLSGLNEWRRVRDWRVSQLQKLTNIEVYFESEMSLDAVRDLGVSHVLVATGAHWRTDGVGRSFPSGVESYASVLALSVEEAATLTGSGRNVVIFDDDQYYLGCTLALTIRRAGHQVTLVTPAGRAGNWSANTAEQEPAQKQLVDLGVRVIVNAKVTGLKNDLAIVADSFSGAELALPCDAFVPVTARKPEDRLWQDLQQAELKTLRRIGDCNAPGIIAHAVYDGHRSAREFGSEVSPRMLRERAFV